MHRYTPPPQQGPSTPDSVGGTTTPQTSFSPDHSFTLQVIFELQKSNGQLTEAIKSLQTSIEKQDVKLDLLGNTVSGITHKIYAAIVVLTIATGIGAFVVNKAWDLMASQLILQAETAPSQTTKSPEKLR